MDKYEVLRVAGRGAYGTAYLARRKTDGREVILKQARIIPEQLLLIFQLANYNPSLYSDSH